MYLIDTSVWIGYLRGKDSLSVRYFSNIVDKNLPFGLCNIIYQEILQGAASSQEFNKLVDYLGSQRFYHPEDSVLSYEAAAKLFFDCRRKGITIRSTIDCLIAQIAIEHDLLLLHDDKDYVQMSTVIPLKLVDVKTSLHNGFI